MYLYFWYFARTIPVIGTIRIFVIFQNQTLCVYNLITTQFFFYCKFGDNSKFSSTFFILTPWVYTSASFFFRKISDLEINTSQTPFFQFDFYIFGFIFDFNIHQLSDCFHRPASYSHIQVLVFDLPDSIEPVSTSELGPSRLLSSCQKWFYLWLVSFLLLARCSLLSFFLFSPFVPAILGHWCETVIHFCCR